MTAEFSAENFPQITYEYIEPGKKNIFLITQLKLHLYKNYRKLCWIHPLQKIGQVPPLLNGNPLVQTVFLRSEDLSGACHN